MGELGLVSSKSIWVYRYHFASWVCSSNGLLKYLSLYQEVSLHGGSLSSVDLFSFTPRRLMRHAVIPRSCLISKLVVMESIEVRATLSNEVTIQAYDGNSQCFNIFLVIVF